MYRDRENDLIKVIHFSVYVACLVPFIYITTQSRDVCVLSMQVGWRASWDEFRSKFGQNLRDSCYDSTSVAKKQKSLDWNTNCFMFPIRRWSCCVCVWSFDDRTYICADKSTSTNCKTRSNTVRNIHKIHTRIMLCNSFAYIRIHTFWAIIVRYK